MQRIPEIGTMADIRVIGVGGGGSNAVDRMIERGIQGVEFIAMNTDAQALLRSQAPTRVRLGDSATRGLGSGGDPEIGENAANESIDHIFEMVKGADMIFVTAGMGGGTGTGAAPIIAREARKVGALTIGVVTKPFFFEGSRRMTNAMAGIERLRQQVDTLIVIPNDRILELTNRQMTLTESFYLADEFLRQGIQGISELITVPGIINLDFADVKTIMSEGGAALMGVGEADGRDGAHCAAERAITSKLLDLTIHGAKGILFNVTGGPDLTLFEVYNAASVVREMAHPDVNLIFGAVIDDNMVNKVRVTVVATGFENAEPRQRKIENLTAKQTPKRQATANSTPERTSINQNVWTVPDLSHDDLSVPAFLRRR
jgi:cell division protein FtsZ